jgi:phosphatidylinositol-3-phosphatase
MGGGSRGGRDRYGDGGRAGGRDGKGKASAHSPDFDPEAQKSFLCRQNSATMGAMRHRLIASFTAVSLVTALCAIGLTPTAEAASAPCGTTTVAHTSYRHVLWIFMENHSYGDVIGSSEAPYTNKLAGQCGLATNYHNITHPSLPNYIAATSGLPLSRLQRFSSDCSPSTSCSTSAKSIFGQTSSWRSYEESMPTRCDKTNAGEYAARHNPAVYYTTLTGCSKKDVPYTHLKTDLANNTLPKFGFITPNVIHDTHDGTIAQGDAWLSHNIPPILDSKAYRTGRLVVVLTYDEGENGSSSDCATNRTDVGCRVATIIMSKSTPKGKRASKLFNHYSLLRTTEEILKLPLLRQARTANSMRKAFGL